MIKSSIRTLSDGFGSFVIPHEARFNAMMRGFTAANSSSPARADRPANAQKKQPKKKSNDRDNHSHARNPLLTEHLGLEPPASNIKSSRAKGASNVPQKRKHNAAATKTDQAV